MYSNGENHNHLLQHSDKIKVVDLFMQHDGVGQMLQNMIFNQENAKRPWLKFAETQSSLIDNSEPTFEETQQNMTLDIMGTSI